MAAEDSSRIDLASTPDLDLAGARLRPALRQFIAGDHTETLEPRVMQVLVALARAPGEVVSRDALLQSCWEGRIVGEDALQRCIARLRKLAQAHGGFELETIPRVGYRLTTATTAQVAQHGEPPILAVLPFRVRSTLPDDEVLAAGMVEDLIGAMLKSVNLQVLASIATLGLRAAAAEDFTAIGRRLGARYILDGSLQRTAGALRVSTQLVDAASGAVLSTGRFERPMDQLADLQEELVLDIAGALSMDVHVRELQRALEKPGELTAWQAVQRCMAEIRSIDPASLRRGLQEAERAVALAPDYAPAHGMRAVASSLLYSIAGRDDRDEQQRIRGLAERALSLGRDDPMVLVNVGGTFVGIGLFDLALPPLMEALRRAPAMGPAHFVLGHTFCLLDRPEDALRHLALAARLVPAPYMLAFISAWRANALMRLGRWDEAEAEIDQALALNPGHLQLSLLKAATCWRARRGGEARAAMGVAVSAGLTFDQASTLLVRMFHNSPISAELAAELPALMAEG